MPQNLKSEMQSKGNLDTVISKNKEAVISTALAHGSSPGDGEMVFSELKDQTMACDTHGDVLVSSWNS